MKPWTLKSFTVSSTDNRTIAVEWYESQGEEVQAAFYTRMEYLINRPDNIWGRPYVGQLRRECRGQFEIVLKVNRVQYRPIGYFSAVREFTFLAFATERDGKLDPLNICETANNRIAVIRSNNWRAREFRI